MRVPKTVHEFPQFGKTLGSRLIETARAFTAHGHQTGVQQHFMQNPQGLLRPWDLDNGCGLPRQDFESCSFGLPVSTALHLPLQHSDKHLQRKLASDDGRDL